MEAHRQVTQQHYDLHAQQQQHKTTSQVLKERQEGPAAPLKKFHNEIKRRLIYRFGYSAPALIDYACGRGGDINKWDAAKVGYVKGLDIAAAEIQEAQRRFGELQARRGAGLRLQADFQHITTLSEELLQEPRQYNVATCMFAIHYFFDKPESLKTLLQTVAANLTDGGYFIGCVPDGKRIKAQLIKSKGLLEAPHLRLKDVTGPPYKAPFGTKYIMEIPDTVVEGHEGFTEGSEEYMVFDKVLLAEAGKVGLYPVLDYADPAVDALFEKADQNSAMKHFAPQYPESTDSSLKTASEVYMAFVFQKVAKAEDARAPALPPPERKPAGAGGAQGGGGGRGGFQGQQQQRQGGRGQGGGNKQQQVSSLEWVLPFQATSLAPKDMPVVSHNLKPERLQQRAAALTRWVIYPPPLPVYSGPVQYAEDGRELYQKLPNGMPIRDYGQELDYWRYQQEQQQQQLYGVEQPQQHLPPPQPQPQPQQHHQQQQQAGGSGQPSNGVQQHQPGPQAAGGTNVPDPPAAPGGRGRGRGRKAAAAAAGGEEPEGSTGRGRGRGGGRGRGRGGRTAGAKRDRAAAEEPEPQEQSAAAAAAAAAAAGEDGQAADDDSSGEHPPKKPALHAPPPAAGPGGADGTGDDDDPGANGHAAAGGPGPGAASAPPPSAAGGAGAEAAAGPPAQRPALSADAKLAKVKAADPMGYKDREQPEPLAPDFLAALVAQAPQYADS